MGLRLFLKHLLHLPEKWFSRRTIAFRIPMSTASLLFLHEHPTSQDFKMAVLQLELSDGLLSVWLSSCCKYERCTSESKPQVSDKILSN